MLSKGYAPTNNSYVESEFLRYYDQYIQSLRLFNLGEKYFSPKLKALLTLPSMNLRTPHDFYSIASTIFGIRKELLALKH